MNVQRVRLTRKNNAVITEAEAINTANRRGPVRCDVGGTPFHVDVEDGGNRTDMIPLRCPPGTTLRPLIAAFGGDEAGSDGVRFLDRDPVIFADVLDYLRTGAADTPSASAAKGAHL